MAHLHQRPLNLLVAAQLSQIFPPSQATTITIPTNRTHTPLPPPPKRTGPPQEHASYASVLHTPTTGTILMRVLHGGFILELISLSAQITPIRLVFPAAILPSPAIFLWDQELHVLAVTNTGSLYRLIIPVSGNLEVWHNSAANVWSREHLIENCSVTLEALVHVQGTHCVAIAMPNGALLRLDTEYLGSQGSEDEWTETVLQPHGSFLSSLTSFLHSNTEGSEIISMATHPWPTDIGYIWTLSRNRVLRFLKPKLGCVAMKTLSFTPGREATPAPGNTTAPKVLLDPSPQTLIRVFSIPPDEYHCYVLVFMPTLTSPASGGVFHLFETYHDQMTDIGIFLSSAQSAHCQLQDFTVIGTELYTLWDRQGQSVVDHTRFSISNLRNHLATPLLWQVATYSQEAELTPAYLEEVLLPPGSMTEKFFDVIMRPGIFSALTLRTAIDQYVDAALSGPGPHPAPLLATYATTGENIAAVVGCTVSLLRDPRTGALRHGDYWNALKRDWEGFIARCREIERSARWPLVLGCRGPGDIIIIERERVGSLVKEDMSLMLSRALIDGRVYPELPENKLFGALAKLSSQLGTITKFTLESRLADIMHQETAFSFADIVEDQAERSEFKNQLDEQFADQLRRELASFGDIIDTVARCLDAICDVEPQVVKEEETEDGFAVVSRPQSEWATSLTSSYISTTIDARYELCLHIILLFYFLAEELHLWPAALLTDVFAVFRGVSILRYIARQPASAATKPPLDMSSSDDVVSLMRSMQVSRSQAQIGSSYSLIHRLLAKTDNTVSVLPIASQLFLDQTAILRSTSPALVSAHEVKICEDLRLLGHYDVCREVISWLPRTAGVVYVLGRLWLNIGRADDAAALFEKVAGSFGPHSALGRRLGEDNEESALAQLLPEGRIFESPFEFYMHVMMLFKSNVLTHHEVIFTRLALSVAPPEVDTTELWHAIIRGYTDLGLYDDAYSTWVATPYETLKRESVAQLVYRTCEDNAIDQLLTYSFAGFADEVEAALSFKARNVDPRLQPNYSRILYSWYTLRGDYKNAALTMYQCARKIHELVGNNPTLLSSLASLELEAYMIASNALSLVDPKNAWILIPGAVEADNVQPRKRRKLSKYIPEPKYSAEKHDAELVHLEDIQYDYALLSAQVDVIKMDPTLLGLAEFLLPPASIVLRLAQANRFDVAMGAARTLKVDMSELFSQLTVQCLRLSRDPDAAIEETWLLSDNVTSWSGSTAAARAWRFLRNSLETHDGPESDYAYTKVVYEIIVMNQRERPPDWLIASLEEHHHEYLIRTSLRFEQFDLAVDHALRMILKADKAISNGPKTAGATWLPYYLIDQVLEAASRDAGIDILKKRVEERIETMRKVTTDIVNKPSSRSFMVTGY